MAIDRIKICNFKSYKGIFELKLNKSLNILVGNNETGKSTILEAIHLALTGMYGGRNIRNELSQYLFNREVIAEYIESVNRGTPLSPPEILIEIFFEGSLCPEFEGNNNTERLNKVEGLQFRIFYNDKYNDKHAKLIALKNHQAYLLNIMMFHGYLSHDKQ